MCLKRLRRLLHREDRLALAHQYRRRVMADVADGQGHVRMQPGILPDVPEGVEVIAGEATEAKLKGHGYQGGRAVATPMVSFDEAPSS